jgi:hypothetical protein
MHLCSSILQTRSMMIWTWLAAILVLMPVKEPSEAILAQAVAVGEVNLTGKWEGIFTQDRNGKRLDFRCEVYIEHKGRDVVGRSIVFDEDISAEMNFKGKFLKDKILRCEETKINRQETRANMEWCLKTYDMVFKADKDVFMLEGLWEGITSFGDCTPGRVYLKKAVPRA